MKDYQQNRVYKWQVDAIPEGGMIDLPNAQAIVNYVWAAEGLHYPPKVNPIHHNTTKWAGAANRFIIELQPTVSMRTLLHEIAHSMTSNVYDESNMHGPLFVGMFIKLAHKYMKTDLFEMISKAGIHNVDVDINSQPIFVD